jgi:hypothetical protein
MPNSRLAADAGAFELLRVKPQRLSTGVVFAVFTSLVVATWFASSSWANLQDARAVQAHRAALLAAGVDQTNRSSSEISAEFVPNANARRAQRDSTARWLAEVERCHPNRAQVRTLRLDAIEYRASMDVTLTVPTTDLEQWLFCLNDELAAPAWRLIRIADVDGPGHVRHVHFGRQQ